MGFELKDPGDAGYLTERDSYHNDPMYQIAKNISMNWYKKAQLEKEAGVGKFLGLTLGTIAFILGISQIMVEKKIQEDPQGLAQEIQQKQVEETQVEETQKNTSQRYTPSENLYNMIERHEGKRNKVYLDTKGIPTIGIGFNLQRADASQKLNDIGVNLNNILNGEILTDQQIYSLFKDDIDTAISDAIIFIPSFNKQPELVKNIVVDMAFNLGLNKLLKFKDFRAALESNNYQEAANEMIDSEWYGQVGNRSKELVNIMRSIK